MCHLRLDVLFDVTCGPLPMLTESYNKAILLTTVAHMVQKEMKRRKGRDETEKKEEDATSGRGCGRVVTIC